MPYPFFPSAPTPGKSFGAIWLFVGLICCGLPLAAFRAIQNDSARPTTVQQLILKTSPRPTFIEIATPDTATEEAERMRRAREEERAEQERQRKADELAKKNEATAAAKFTIAQRILTENRNPELARKKAQEVIDLFPATKAAESAKAFLAKLNSL